MSRKLTTEEFIVKANTVHNNFYDYSNTVYASRKSYVMINCVKHGLFKQMVNAHLKGQGCPNCARENSRLSNDEFIKQANEVHKNRYDYNNTRYINARNLVEIRCLEHGVFYQRPYDHLNGCGCKKCVGLNLKTNDEFIEESKKIFENEFEYSKTNYINSQKHVIIICKKHGDFKITPNNHLSKKQGCPICKQSKGEKIIRDILNNLNIDFVQQKIFENCVGKKRKLPFDFYLPNKNLIIEYDGKQHFEMVKAFGGKKSFDETQKNDKIKNEYALKNNINLIRISYHQYDNIDNILRNSVL